MCIRDRMEIKQEGDEVVVTRPNDLKKMKSLHGLTRTLIDNMVIGVTNGYEKVLEVNGCLLYTSEDSKDIEIFQGLDDLWRAHEETR